MCVVAEGALGAGEVELPHADEALVVELEHRLAVGEEAAAPFAGGLGVVQREDLGVADQEAGPSRRRGKTSERAGM